MNPKELPLDRLATTDQKGNRIYLYPADVASRTGGRASGWRKWRSRLSIILIFLFVALPWIKINGSQAILIDIPNHRFAILGLTFWAHDAPLLFFVFGGAAILLAFVTAVWGRIWCGWGCPQTVFVDQVFRRVERWIEGDSLARRKLDEAPLGVHKLTKKALKWGLFLFLSLILSHSLLAYFIGTEALARMMASTPRESPAAFSVMAGLAAAILFDFGWFREQFCTVLCPYGRFQSVLMDDQSTVVAYDLKRGEPRRGTEPAEAATGDCVNCYRCVQVCPTGIDIRRGVQLECIACTSCIDACDEVMTRLKKPSGLIRYANQAVTEGKDEVRSPWFKRTRAWIYLGFLMMCALGLTFTIRSRNPIEVTLIRAPDFPYQEIPGTDGHPFFLNHFKVDIRNLTFTDQEILFSLEPKSLDKGIKLVVSNHSPSLAAGVSERADFFIQFPKGILKHGQATLSLRLSLLLQAHGLRELPQRLIETHLVGPLW